MARVRSKRLFGPIGLSTSIAPIHTVDGAQTAVIRSLILANRSGAAATCRLSINGSSIAAAMLWDHSIPAGDFVVVPDLVLDAGDVLWGRASAGNTITAAAFGSLLDAPWGGLG